MSVINKVILLVMYIASERILLALLNPQGESPGMHPVVVVPQTNHLNYPYRHLEGDFINKILYKYLEPVYRSRKATHASVEFGPGSFKHTNVKLPDDHLVRQFKKLLQMKERMENKS